MNIYPLDSYDKNFALKMSVGSIFWLVFLGRGLLIVPIHLYLEEQSVKAAEVFYATDLQLLCGLLLALPVLVLIVTWGARSPSSGDFFRIIWGHGRSILIFTATLNLPLVVWSTASRHNIPSSDIVQIVVALYCLIYVIRSKRLQDVFKSFPAQEPEKLE